jgi:hypothetical protein
MYFFRIIYVKYIYLPAQPFQLSPLMMASVWGNEEAVEVLLDTGRVDVNLVDVRISQLSFCKIR